MDKHAETAERAYFIWERMGCPQDKALDRWLEAEMELKSADTVREYMQGGHCPPHAPPLAQVVECVIALHTEFAKLRRSQNAENRSGIPL